MTGRNLLAVVLEERFQATLREAIAQDDETSNVRVVIPVRVGPLQWLATDEDDAWGRAAAHALEAEWLLADQANLEAAPGEGDPVQAVDDALRGFHADEILLVGETSADDGLENSLRRFGLPVTRVPGSIGSRRNRNRLRSAVRSVVERAEHSNPVRRLRRRESHSALSRRRDHARDTTRPLATLIAASAGRLPQERLRLSRAAR